LLFNGAAIECLVNTRIDRAEDLMKNFQRFIDRSVVYGNNTKCKKYGGAGWRWNGDLRLSNQEH
jgi:hypothetical protein